MYTSEEWAQLIRRKPREFRDETATDDLSPIEAELIAQARDIQNAEYQFRENEFLRKLDVASFIGMGL